MGADPQSRERGQNNLPGRRTVEIVAVFGENVLTTQPVHGSAQRVEVPPTTGQLVEPVLPLVTQRSGQAQPRPGVDEQATVEVTEIVGIPGMVEDYLVERVGVPRVGEVYGPEAVVLVKPVQVAGQGDRTGGGAAQVIETGGRL